MNEDDVLNFVYTMTMIMIMMIQINIYMNGIKIDGLNGFGIKGFDYEENLFLCVNKSTWKIAFYRLHNKFSMKNLTMIIFSLRNIFFI